MSGRGIESKIDSISDRYLRGPHSDRAAIRRRSPERPHRPTPPERAPAAMATRGSRTPRSPKAAPIARAREEASR